MYTKLKRSIVQFITMMGLAMVITGLLGLSPAQAADGEANNVISASDTTKSLDAEVSGRTDAPSTVSGDVADVLTANAGFIGKSKKVKACKAYAEKIEQQAPPRDPQALCKGKLKVKLFGKIVASCPTGYLGAKVTLMASLRQVVSARAFAKSIASGRVRTWAEFKIRDLAKIKGKTHIQCVLIPVITPPPPPPVEHDECPYIPGNQPVGYVCNPTPPPPPVYDHCPNLPGDQPSGYDCYPTPPPVHDECPNIPGDQPVGYECYPTPPPPSYTCPPGTTWTDIDKDGIKEEGECFGPPTFTQFREFNDLYHSLPDMPTTMDHFVTVDTPASHSYTVTWESVWGSFATPNKQGQDGVQVSNTYAAPSEVPPAHPEMGLQAGYDKIMVTVTDNVTGQRIVRSTAPFRIKSWPSD